jgi:hypothetical protein
LIFGFGGGHDLLEIAADSRDLIPDSPDGILDPSGILAGIPQIGFLGNTARRLSTALREAKHWKPFKVRLCPSLAGIELLKDGGFYVADLDPEARRPVDFSFQPLPR